MAYNFIKLSDAPVAEDGATHVLGTKEGQVVRVPASGLGAVALVSSRAPVWGASGNMPLILAAPIQLDLYLPVAASTCARASVNRHPCISSIPKPAGGRILIARTHLIIMGRGCWMQ